MAPPSTRTGAGTFEAYRPRRDTQRPRMMTFQHFIGHWMGGLVAQEVALARPELVRRLVLVGTGPRGGEGIGA